MDFVFYSGETKRLKVRLNKQVCGLARPYSLAQGAVVTFILPTSQADLELQTTISNYDLGEVYVDLSAAQTETLISGDLIIKIVSGSNVRIARKSNIIRKLKK